MEKIDFSKMEDMERLLKACYEETREVNGGMVANYIPQLASVNPDLYGVAFCDKNGNIMGIGDCDKSFCLQSTVKPLNYCLARLQEYENEIDAPVVHNHVGFEPSGVKFNAFVLNDDGLPHNPLINSGAIMTASLIAQKDEPSHRFSSVQNFIGRLSGMGESAIGFDNGVYLSEQVHADRNISLAYYMRENKAYAGQPTQSELMENLNLYFQTCSLTCNCKTMASIAATLAFHGKSPVSGEDVVKPEIVMDCLSIMYMCGMYDFSGQFAFHVGLPCKSGVSGAMMLVIPNVGGLCIWSPPLDSMGNSVRGLAFCNAFTTRTNSLLHVFRVALKSGESQIEDEDEIGGIRNIETLTMRLIHCCAVGDVEKFKKLVEFGSTKFAQGNESKLDASKRILEIGDYDKRTCLHLAAAEGHVPIIEQLVGVHKVEQKQDRWGVTPLHEVRKHVYNLKNPTGDSIKEYRKIIELLCGKVMDDVSFDNFIRVGHIEQKVNVHDEQSHHGELGRSRGDSDAGKLNGDSSTHFHPMQNVRVHYQQQQQLNIPQAVPYEGSPTPTQGNYHYYDNSASDKVNMGNPHQPITFIHTGPKQ